MTINLFVPTYTELHPADTFLAPRTTINNLRWVFHDIDQSFLDKSTGLTVALAGNMPLICHESVATTAILQIMRTAGLTTADNIITFQTEEEAYNLALEQISKDTKLVYYYPPVRHETLTTGLLNPISLYKNLNNKINLEKFVNHQYLPSRTIFRSTDFTQLYSFNPSFPVYVKAAFSGANGAGYGVRYCSNLTDWQKAIHWGNNNISDLDGVVIENAIDIQKTWCLNLSLNKNRISYLGGAQQLFSKVGQQNGSRIDSDFPVPDEATAVVIEIAELAIQKQYQGILGVDVGIDSDNNLYVFDLNFRINSSTNQVLLHKAATDRVRLSISQSFQVSKDIGLEHMLEMLLPFVETGRFIPYRLFDKEKYNEIFPEISTKSTVTGIILGNSIDEITALDQNIRQRLNV